MKKEMIQVTHEQINTYYLEGKLSTVRDTIDEWIAQYGPDAVLDFERDFYYSYDQNPTPMFFMRGHREETDEEFNKRVKEATDRKRQIEEMERAQFLELSKKYGK